MTAGDVVVVVLCVLIVLLAGVLVSVLVSLARALRELQASLAELRNDVLPLVGELHEAVDTTVANVDRVDRLITSAESIEGRVDSASRLAYRTISSPIVKMLATAAGIKSGWRRLRGKAPAAEAVSEPAAKSRRQRRKAS
jgi:predicted PurR-regulated permease PerM